MDYVHAYEKPTAMFSLEHSIFLKIPTNGKQMGKKSPDLPFVGNSADSKCIYYCCSYPFDNFLNTHITKTHTEYLHVGTPVLTH